MKSLNKVQLIGNLTRDPELRYTAGGVAVCSMGLATNRQWTTDTGEKKEEVEWHNLTAWNKLADICGQLLKKGRKVYIEGRLQTRNWQDKDGQTKYMTEIVLSDMILLDSRRDGETSTVVTDEFNVPENLDESQVPAAEEPTKSKGKSKKEEVKKEASDDIPF